MDSTPDTRGQTDGRILMDAHEFQTELLRSEIDSTDPAYVSYHLTAETWQQATAISRTARRAGWLPSVYVDGEQWVVRLVQCAEPGPQFIRRTRRYIDNLARRHGSQVRGVSVEHPLRDDCWDELAARLVGALEEALCEPPSAPARIPAQRHSSEAPASCEA